MDQSVAIVGAGMAGLGTAYTLRRHGIAATLFEPSHKAGGRMTTETIGDFHVDIGASFVIRYFNTVAPLVHEIGMGDEMGTLARNGASLYRDGRFHTVNMGNLATVLTFTGFSTKAKLSALRAMPEYLRHYTKINEFLNAYKGLALDDAENAHDWLRRCTSAELADHLGDSICRALCCYPLKEMSKLNFMVYSLLLKDLKLFQFRDGMGSVPRRLAQDMDIRYHTRVLRVVQKHERVEVTFQAGDAQPETRDYAAAVVATWGDVVPDIVEGLSDVETAILRDTRYSATTPVVITLDRPLEEPFYGVYLGPGESDIVASFGVEDAKGNLGVPAGKGCLFCLTREEFARSFTGSDQELGAVVTREAQRFFPHIAGHITGVHTFRWQRAVEKMPPGRFSALNALKAQWPADRRIFVAGSYLVAPCTDGAFHSGKLAARQVMQRLGAGPGA